MELGTAAKEYVVVIEFKILQISTPENEKERSDLKTGREKGWVWCGTEEVPMHRVFFGLAPASVA